MTVSREKLLKQAREAAAHAYAPYSQFAVGAALAFEDGAVVTGANVENASYGLSLCAEALALSKAMNEGRRGGLLAVAVVGLAAGQGAVTPCGRCRQMLSEMAQLGGTDPVVWSGGGDEAIEVRLSALLPMAFGPDNLKD
ncbi:MAG: cytidine deaminase [Novosphingobium sp.]|nr:cytidine deaminase [Novosphingobium sp.]